MQILPNWQLSAFFIHLRKGFQSTWAHLRVAVVRSKSDASTTSGHNFARVGLQDCNNGYSSAGPQTSAYGRRLHFAALICGIKCI